MLQLAELQEIDNILETGVKPKGGLSFTALEGKKSKIEKKIDARILQYYRRIREKFENPVVTITDGYCSACRMQIPPLIRQKVKNKIGYHFCESCGRILY